MQSATRPGTGREVENQPARNVDDSDGRRRLSANGPPGSPELAIADAPQRAPRINPTSSNPLGIRIRHQKVSLRAGNLRNETFQNKNHQTHSDPTPLDCGNI